MFVDSATVLVKAGNGGSGIVSFRHERAVTRGGPDGGDGGNGGNVVIIASDNENTLANFRYQKELIAEDGVNGRSAKMHGRRGKDLEVRVPVGTQVYIKGELVADLVIAEQRLIVAQGGKGGFGNAHFTSSVRQAPKVAEKGEPGDEYEVALELKILADVGLVGLPNAGKSTLLATISAAKPKIANYPFTTLNPHLGVVKVEAGKELLIADIPGLIDGASEGKGLGDEFLRHVERTQVILHMIDAYSDDVARDYLTIQKELQNYKIDLTKKPQIITLTKIEGLDDKIVADQIRQIEAVAKDKVTAISALSKQGLQQLLYSLHTLVTAERDRVRSAAATTDSDIPVLRLQERDDAWQLRERGKNLVVTGRKIEKFAVRTDFANEDGVRRLRDIMRKMGIMRSIDKKQLPLGTKVYFGTNVEDYLEL